ncbi:MAG: glycosyltransferase family 2 protein [Xanthobacteraceae bacterium]|nr:glycosyltransferase family 2 protein [Xanthobacteraceae bacterium]
MAESEYIFSRYYSKEEFVDRFARGEDAAVDIIIPVLSSNELWEKNLISIYREIPVNRLLLGDAGCADDTITTARKFPRVEVLDHRHFKSLGYSVRELIKAVETEWFIYLHSDVYLPDGWFDTMRKHQGEYDWFGCPMRITALIEYPLVNRERPYAGSQMGRKSAFMGGIDRIDDDYVYRQEDFVFARIVEDGNFRHGKIEDTFHYHQLMPRLYGNDDRARKFTGIEIGWEMSPEEELTTVETQVRGTIKYLRPDRFQVLHLRTNLVRLHELRKVDLGELKEWTLRVNPEWLPYIPRRLKTTTQRAKSLYRHCINTFRRWIARDRL